LLDLFTPHEHLMRGYEGPPELADKVKRSWLVALAITIHNIPEGLAVGVSTAYHVELGFVTALAIAIQDVPKGAAVVMPLLRYRLVKTAVAVGVLSALVEGGAAVVSGVAAAGLPSVLGARHGGRRRRDALRDRGGAVPRHLRPDPPARTPTPPRLGVSSW
jgi:ZIP family zinc transporter